MKVNGKTVIEGEISQAVSRNPVFSFRLKGAKTGDKIEVTWIDNKGDTNKTVNRGRLTKEGPAGGMKRARSRARRRCVGVRAGAARSRSRPYRRIPQ